MTLPHTDRIERAIYRSVSNRGCATVRDVRNDIDYSLAPSKISGILRILCRRRLIQDSGNKDRYGSTIWTSTEKQFETTSNF